MKIFAFIFARGGSKGIPHKNISPLCGKPLIAHTIELAKKMDIFERIIVSTDSESIADIAREYGAETPFMRPEHLSIDTANEWLAWQHAVDTICTTHDDPFDVFVALPATSPLRTCDDIHHCITTFNQSECDLLLTYADTSRTPYVNMLSIDDQSFARVAIQLENAPYRRQDSPKIYDATGVAYVSTPAHILSRKNLWDGKIKAVKVDRINALDIDEPIDLELAEFFMHKRNSTLLAQ